MGALIEHGGQEFKCRVGPAPLGLASDCKGHAQVHEVLHPLKGSFGESICRKLMKRTACC